MDARRGIRYLVHASSFKKIDETMGDNNNKAGENKLSKNFTCTPQWIANGPPLSCSQVLTFQNREALRSLQNCIDFYNESYTGFVQNQVLHPGDFSTIKLDALFKKMNVKRYTVQKLEDHGGIRAIRRDRQLICMDSSDKRECCDSQIGPGLSLSSWPPNTPFLHFAATLGSAEIVSHLINHYGCWVDSQQKEERGTALHLAAYYGHLNVVNALLQANPDITLRNSIKQENSDERLTETAIESAEEGKRAYNALPDHSKMDFFPIIRKETKQRNRFSSKWRGEWDAIITTLRNYKP
jgi:hypothetical protein